MLPLAQQTGKQQRTFGSFYLAIDQPLTRPFWYRPCFYLFRQRRLSQSDLNELLAHGHGIAGNGIRHLGIDGSEQRQGQEE